jgi:hypothetical protein
MTNLIIDRAANSATAASMGTRTRRFCTSVVLTIFSLQGLVGCGAPDDPRGGQNETTDVSVDSAPAPRMNISTEIDGTLFSASLVQEDGALVGTRTVTYADGRSETEDVNIPLDGAGVSSALDQVSQTPLGAGLRITSSERSASGTNYVLETNSGLTFHLATEGEAEYLIVELAAAVLITALIVCGTATVTSIIACAARDRCWAYGGSLFDVSALCSGSCRKC